MDLLSIIQNKRNLIESFKNNFTFIGSIFNNSLQYTRHGSNVREIICKYYNNINVEINDIDMIKILFDRLKLKFTTQNFNFIYINTNYITLFNNTFTVKFFMQDSYGEFINPIILNNIEIKKLILHELSILKNENMSWV